MPPFEWSWQVKFGDLITLVGLLIASASLLVSTNSFRKNSRGQQIKALFDVMNQHFSSEDVRDLFDKLDMNKNNPKAYRFPGRFSPDDGATATLSKLLYALDVVGRMLRVGILTRRDVDVIGFRVWRTVGNPETQRFLEYLDREYKDFGPPSFRRAHDDARYLLDVISKRHWWNSKRWRL